MSASKIKHAVNEKKKSKGRTNLYVSNFGDRLDVEALRNLFAEYGQIISSMFPKYTNGTFKGYGYISFETESMAEQAITNLNDHQLANGRELAVCFSDEKDKHQAKGHTHVPRRTQTTTNTFPNNNGSTANSNFSTQSLGNLEFIPRPDEKNVSQSTSEITSVDERECADSARLVQSAINLIKAQANPDLPIDVPPEWHSQNLQSGDAGGQGEVRIIYYKNQPMYKAAIKIYSADKNMKKSPDNQDVYSKERRMRAHRELTALRALKVVLYIYVGVPNVAQLTSYTNDYTNIPDNVEDAIAQNKIYWTIMDYISLSTLEKFIDTLGGIDLLDAIKLTQKLLLTIKEIHGKGIVHRDIKPKNLLVIHNDDSQIETAEIHIVDFGLAYIENRDDIDWSSFEEKEQFRETNFGYTYGNIFYRAPQLNPLSWKGKTQKEQNALQNVRRSPTIDASSICAILFWLITDIEPGPKHRNVMNLAPHQCKEAQNRIDVKIGEAVDGKGSLSAVDIGKEMLIGLKQQLKNYIITTFDRGFENAEYQWTIEQLEYRLESIRHILDQNMISLDQQLSDATKSLLSFEPIRVLSSLCTIKIFSKVSDAFESAKIKFVVEHSAYSWYDGKCYWLDNRQNMIERKSFDVLCYQQKRQSWKLIFICSVHFNENGDIVTLTVGTDINGMYIELPVGQYNPNQLDNLNIEMEFEREVINLLQAICKIKQ
ncbi:unnamed protein product [Adineta steineri]|uniref:Non-specific serine/threonine protein kinase n=1 Tax=Adineta steineri TaxID=433720 RepID=A0A818ZDU5_9BILA|nr:unnamed protein product [Adineta steineri]CAF3767132.1 unnamed protein product [Adineta steineri]